MAAAAESGSHQVDLAADPAAGLEALAAVAERWGASWVQDGVAGGRLAMPARAGVRRGLVEGTVTVTATGTGSRMTFAVEDRFYRVQYTAFVFLLLGALGGLSTIVAPFVPRLWPLVPVGIMLALAAWLLIAARLHYHGPDELLGEVAEACRRGLAAADGE